VSLTTAWAPSIDFALWALQRDGLHVPGFDAHQNGDGSLQRSGLSTEVWEGWLWNLIRQTAAFYRSGTGMVRERRLGSWIPDNVAAQRSADLRRFGTTLPARRAAALRLVQDPALDCPGPAVLVQRLRELWEMYLAQAQREPVVPTGPMRGLISARAPTAWVGIVTYLKPVGYAVPPDAGICALPNPDDLPARRAMVATVVNALADGQGRARAVT
jgi:hypothetical protein